jgi:hypothetical protein
VINIEGKNTGPQCVKLPLFSISLGKCWKALLPKGWLNVRYVVCLSERMSTLRNVFVIFLHVFQPSIANATNIDTLLVATEKEDKMTPPPEALQDKIGFVFNNLSQLNLQTKVS